MSYESEREDRAVGPEICEECNHPFRLHGPDGCEGQRSGVFAGGVEGPGPCGCEAVTLEPIEEQGLEPEYLQTYLERCYAVYLTNSAALIQQRGVTFPSPLVARRNRLNEGFDAL